MRRPEEDDEPLDALIVGAGIAGSLAATLLARAGRRVALVDLSWRPKQDFRVEKIVGPPIEELRRLGLLAPLVARATAVDEVLSVIRGRRLDRRDTRHFSISYTDIVEVCRDGLPETVDRIEGRVVSVSTSPTLQTVSFQDGRRLAARVVVLATGHAARLRSDLGIGFRPLLPVPTLCFGIDLRTTSASACPVGVTFYGDDASHGIDYAAFLPTREGLRGNLFSFSSLDAPWIGALRSDPGKALPLMLPGFETWLSGWSVSGRPDMFVATVACAERHGRDGIVLIGDAFMVSCPAGGTGFARLLTDVSRLCEVHLPAWLDAPDRTAARLSSFYADATKVAADQSALRIAEVRRGFTLRTSLSWTARRHLHFGKRGLLAAMKAVRPSRRGPAPRADEPLRVAAR